MKIFYVENVRVPSERAHAYQIVQTCAWLSRFGHQVTLVNPARAGDKDLFSAYNLPKDLFTHVTLKSWDPLTLSPRFLKAIAYAIQRWAFVRVLKVLAQTRQADAWYTRDPAMIDALCGTVAGPWFLELHDAPDNDPARWARIRDHVVGFIVISNGLKNKLAALDIPQSKICVAHDGHDPQMFVTRGDRSREREALGIPDDAFVAIYTGSFYLWKGIDLVVRAWEHAPERSHLVLVGGPEPDRKRILALVGPQASQRVHILSTVLRERVIAMLAAADICLLTSSSDEAIGRLYTSPLKQFEYMAAGLPVLASDVPSSHEVLDERMAKFYEPTEAGFLKSLASMHEDAVWRESASRIARNVVSLYTWEARTKIIEDCLRKHLSSLHSV